MCAMLALMMFVAAMPGQCGSIRAKRVSAEGLLNLPMLITPSVADDLWLASSMHPVRARSASSDLSGKPALTDATAPL